MSRPLRVLFPGALYHVFSRGNDRRPIFGVETDFVRFLELLALGIDRHGWRCHAYCLMHNHYHLLVDTPRANLSEGMRHLNGCYAQDFHRRHGTVGHLFQGRFGATLVEKDEGHVFAVVRYIARNPVAAGICERPQDWPWSSYAALIGERPPPDWLTTHWLLGLVGSSGEAARRRLRSYVEAAEPDVDLGVRGVYLGSDSFIDAHTPDLAAHDEIPRSHRRPIRQPLGQLLASNDPIVTAYRGGYAMSEIARHLGCHYSTVSRRLREHEEAAGGSSPHA